MLRTKYIALSTIMPLVLVACGKSEDRAAPPKSPAATSAPAPAPAPSPAPVPAPTTAAPPAAAPQAPAAGTTGTAGAKPAGGAARSAATPAADTHVVARGDTLQKIAKARGVSVEDLARWNNIDDPRRLRVGQELRLTPP